MLDMPAAQLFSNPFAGDGDNSLSMLPIKLARRTV